MFEWIFSIEGWIAFATLAGLEIVLGIDNIVFISVLVGGLPPGQREKARRLGIALALISRLLLLFTIAAIMKLVYPLWTIFGNEISIKDLILIIGGLFLIAKSTNEIHNALEIHEEAGKKAVAKTMTVVIIQIAIVDIIFSLDSVITAVGLVDYLSMMVLAIILAVVVMLLAASAISNFVDANPTIKMLALAFLILIGFVLVADGLDMHIPKGYVYFAMAFSLGVEMLNIRARKGRERANLTLGKKLPAAVPAAQKENPGS